MYLYRSVLGKVYENVVFFGDFVLRMPDITRKVTSFLTELYYWTHSSVFLTQVLKSHREWLPVLKEAVQFCNQSSEIYTGPHARQLHLVCAAVGISVACSINCMHSS